MAARSKNKSSAGWPITGEGILAGPRAAAKAEQPKKRKHVIEGKVRYLDASLHGPALAAELDRVRAEILGDEPARDLREVLAESIAQTTAEADAAVAIAEAAGTEPVLEAITPPALTVVPAEAPATSTSSPVMVVLTTADLGMAYGALGRFAYRAFDSWAAAALAPSIGLGEEFEVDFTRPHLATTIKALVEQLDWLRTKAKEPNEPLIGAVEELLGRLEEGEAASA